MPRHLTRKQQEFVAAYLGAAHGVGVQAARMAGYRGSDHTLRSTATDLLSNPVIKAAIDEAYGHILQEGIAARRERIRGYQERRELLYRVLAERAETHAGEAPGSGTGALVRTFKQLRNGRVVEEWAVDRALLDELRQLEQQAARELGQWVDKIAPTDPSGERPYEQLSDAELDARAAALLALRAGTPDGDDPQG